MSDFERSDSSLLYVQVSDYVREKIYSKEWGVDDRIPSEHELMAMLHLSRGTVQKGIRTLVDEGLLVQQRGRGTFVTQPVMARPSSNSLLSFAESMSVQGIPFETHVVERSIETAGKACAWQLGIERGSSYLYLARVREVFGEPVMCIESHLNIEAIPDLVDADFEHEGLFSAVERCSGRSIGRSEMVYSARACGKKRGAWLRCDEHAPVLDLDQLVRLDDGTPFEWGSVWLPANRCVISSATERSEGSRR
ncbi:MAG: GntR family transcriptional regulator [Atopobiaceae bacterium]|nr:GntR family transcriptional regulator [Atopobiaceae bacterium]MCH4180178.1 GntR family transcriptional regulator [Atopobiaceae bacterium]MCH4214348.1 GntR family transcriptional regulator [Atopobiaceae bacterium]MCH4229221.1 GntR family transcriptional regulator [Atopobiaceae bacterium]MCH4276592.1 GntR family transcriptional regulator [Atopobiaceae bacterium]